MDRAWSQAWAAEIGQNIQRIRKTLGVSASRLSEACSDLGYGIPRSTIANLESGRKESVPVHELVVIAEALGVPPLHLLYPIDLPSSVQYVPTVDISAYDAWNRFSRGLHTAHLPLEITEARATEKVEVILTCYAELADIERNWTALKMASQQIGLSAGRNAASRNAVEAEMAGWAREAVSGCQCLVDAGLPLPTFGEDFANAVRDLRAQREVEATFSEDGVGSDA